jgi:PAS domain S-box-containing protein
MSDLREKAEKLVDETKLFNTDLTKEDKLSIIYELLVHQRELEIQNEEIRRANIELEELKNSYLELYNSVPVGYLTLDEVGIILSYNKTFINMVNSDNNIKDRAFSDFIYDKDKRTFLSVYREFFSNPENKSIELRLKNKTNYFYGLITGRKNKSNSNLNITITDISSVKEANLKLQTYMNILESAPVSIIITDRKNKIVYLNNHYCNITGYSKNELIGKDPGILKSGKTPNETYKSLWDSIRKKTPWEGIFINKKKNGEFFTEESKINPIIDEDGNIVYYVAVKTDITEKLKLQEKMQKFEKLRSLISISAGIAHHLNNINTPIMIMSEELSRELDNPKYKEMLNVIRNSVIKATDIINSIRKFSRNMVMMKRNIKIKNLIDFILKQSEILLKEITIIKEYNIPDDLEIKVDIDLINQAIQHILKNSKEAISNDGKIVIRLHTTYFDENNMSGKYLLIQIEDNGIGIPEHIMPNIFEPFFTTKLMHNAPGLGLSEALGIIEQHGGTIQIKSDVNKGTEVTIILPLKND